MLRLEGTDHSYLEFYDNNYGTDRAGYIGIPDATSTDQN